MPIRGHRLTVLNFLSDKIGRDQLGNAGSPAQAVTPESQRHHERLLSIPALGSHHEGGAGNLFEQPLNRRAEQNVFQICLARGAKNDEVGVHIPAVLRDAVAMGLGGAQRHDGARLGSLGGELAQIALKNGAIALLKIPQRGQFAHRSPGPPFRLEHVE